MHFIDEENIVTYVDFDCGITFLPETPTKIRQINRERNYISRSCEKPQCIPSNDQHVCLVDEQHSSNIFLTPYILWDMSPAALTSLNHNNDRYSISNQYPQPTTHQPRTDSYPVFSSLRTMNSKRKGLRVSFAFFQKKLLTGRTSERNSCYGWRVEWFLEARTNGWSSTFCDELYLYLSVAICFTCLLSIVCCCEICCFFRKFTFFCSLSLMTLSEQ